MIIESARPRTCEVRYGTSTFLVGLHFRPGERLAIHVHPDQRVTADLPEGQPVERALTRLQARAGWIARQLRHFEHFKPLPVPRRYVSGETILYLGRQYRLRVRIGNPARVRMSGPFLCVETPVPGDRSRVKALVDRWYRVRAPSILTDRFQACVAATKSMQLPPPTLRLRHMRTRWGSCTKTGAIVLNPDLVMVPSQCIDYVIVHELCHRKVLRHDRRFYALLARYLPDWQRRKKRLDQFVIPLSDIHE